MTLFGPRFRSGARAILGKSSVTRNFAAQLLKRLAKHVLVVETTKGRRLAIDAFAQALFRNSGTSALGASALHASPMTLRERVSEYFVALREPVYGYLARFCGSTVEAEDLTQEAFLKLYRHLREGKEIDNVRSWLFQVARNLAVSRARSQLPVGEMPDLLDAENVPSENASSEELILERERDERLRTAMKELTDFQRQCLHLRAEGLRYREIADTLSTSIDSVADALQRAISKLRRTVHD
jgi:RNA polymerase sigma-70 factor (ECF subfamily)